MSELDNIHLKEYEKRPDVIVHVPQVTTILGDMSDVIGGKSLMCTNDRGLDLTVSRREDNVVRIINIVKQDKKKFTIGNPKYRKEDKWANAFKAILLELGKRGYRPSGLNIILGGVGSATDSYSITVSVFVGMLAALEKLFGFHFSMDEKLDICLSASAFSLENAIRRRDVLVLLQAEEGKIYLYDGDKGELSSTLYGLDNSTSYLLNSALPYSVLTPEEEEYRLKSQVSYQAFLPNLKKGTFFRDYTEKEVRFLLSRLPDAQKRCLLHLHQGSDSASKAFEALKNRNAKEFGRILSVNGRSNVVNAELSSPELDWIYRRGTEEKGVLGLSLISVGIAGTFLVSIADGIESPYRKHVEEYERIFGFHSDVRPFVPSGSVIVSEPS